MKRMFAAGAIGVVMAAPVSLRADETADLAAIQDIWQAYQVARVAGDAEAWLGLWDDGGVQMPPGAPARGVDALRVGVPKAFQARPATAMEISPVETVITGDWAFSRGTYTATQIVSGEPVDVDGKFMTIFRRQDDGTWRIYRDIFNSNG